MRKRVISTLLAMATTAGLFAGNVSAVYAESHPEIMNIKSLRMPRLHIIIIL